jgi:8-oxo-dGTP pyrophosphatase MutT (NUDIX family)/phosphohistidine phosphatase SixA
VARTDVIRASGVVLLRQHDGVVEVLIVHRPLRADWSLPKGKVDEGEHVINTAIRECDEETGFTPILGAPLPMQQYSVMGRPKIVNYWSATVGVDEGFAPDDEIDEICWIPVTAAAQYLTYPADVALIEQANARPATVPLIILRHTQAMKRADFDGDVDSERPLSGRGRSQSKQLVPLLDAFGIAAVHASSARRCSETVRRYAKHLGVSVEQEPDLTEEAHHEDAQCTAARAVELAAIRTPLVLCTHRPVLPTILDTLAEALVLDPDVPNWGQLWDPKLPPGGFIVIHRSFTDDGQVAAVGVERHTLSA